MKKKNDKTNATKVRFLVYLAVIMLGWLIFYTRPYSYGEDAFSYESNEVRLYGVDFLLYYAQIWEDKFVAYPLIIQICYVIIILSIIALIGMLITMLSKIYERRKTRKAEKKIYDKFYEPFKAVCEDKERLRTDEIRSRTDYDTDIVWSKAEMQLWIKMFIQIHTEMTEESSEENFQASLTVVGVIEYIDHELSYGAHRKKGPLLEDLMCLNGHVPESAYINLANDKLPDTQRLAREAYILMSMDDPYRFFNDETDRSVCLMAQLTIHWILQQREKANKINPSMIPVIDMQSCTPVVAFLIREVGYFGNEEDMTHVIPYFSSSEQQLRKAAFECVGNYKHLEAEKTMMNVFNQQTDELQWTILDSVMRIGSGTALDFLTQAYSSMDVRDTRRAALRSIYMYGDDGRRVFERLRLEAPVRDRRMFEHVEDKLINNEQ